MLFPDERPHKRGEFYEIISYRRKAFCGERYRQSAALPEKAARRYGRAAICCHLGAGTSGDPGGSGGI